MEEKEKNYTACADFSTGVVERAPKDRWRKNAAPGRRPRGRLPNKMPQFFVFLSPVTLTFDR